MKPGTILGGGSTVLSWALLSLAGAGVSRFAELVSSPIMWGWLGATVLLAFGTMGYRALKLKAGADGIEVGAEGRSEGDA